MKHFKFSQNFLKSRRLVTKLVDKADISKEDIVFDIGSGKGVITSVLKEKVKEVISIEPDINLYTNLVDKFKEDKNVKIYNLKFQDYKLPSYPYKVFSNIPFNDTSAILKKLLTNENFVEGHIIMQIDAARRYMGEHSDSPSTLLSIIFHNNFDFKISFRFNANDFFPEPNVKVVMVKIKRHERIVEKEYEKLFFDFVAYLFSSPTKFVNKPLEKIFSKKQLFLISKNLGVSRKQKPNELGFDHFKYLYDLFLQYNADKASLIFRSYDKMVLNERKMTKSFRTRTK